MREYGDRVTAENYLQVGWRDANDAADIVYFATVDDAFWGGPELEREATDAAATVADLDEVTGEAVAEAMLDAGILHDTVDQVLNLLGLSR